MHEVVQELNVELGTKNTNYFPAVSNKTALPSGFLNPRTAFANYAVLSTPIHNSAPSSNYGSN